MNLYKLTFFFSIFLFLCCEKDIKNGQSLEKYSSYEEAGFDSEKIHQLSKFIEEKSNTTGLYVLHKGKEFFQYGDINDISYIASCRKSILAILMGKYVKNKTINLDMTLDELQIDDVEGLLDIEKRAKIDHLATSRSGVFHVASNGGYDEKNILPRGSKEPGSYYVYNNWDFNALGFIFEKLVKNSIYNELENQIAQPLGFQNWDLKLQKRSGDSKKSKYLAYHMYLSTQDMAKVGQLMLNNGKWNGKQLIPKNWINKIITPVTSKDTVMSRTDNSKKLVPDFGYSYMWWTFDSFRENEIYKGSYSARGFGGQYITVIPKIELVIAHKTNLKKSLGNHTKLSTYFEIVDQIVKSRIY